MSRLNATDSFRARAWRDLIHQQRVRMLSPRAFRLLAGIVWTVLDKNNNGKLPLGPKTLHVMGESSRAKAKDAIAELIDAKLLQRMTETVSGAMTHYGCTFTPFMIYPTSKLSTRGQVDERANLSAGGQLPPEKLSTRGQDLSIGGQVKTRRLIGPRARMRARSPENGSERGGERADGVRVTPTGATPQMPVSDIASTDSAACTPLAPAALPSRARTR